MKYNILATIIVFSVFIAFTQWHSGQVEKVGNLTDIVCEQDHCYEVAK